ncbi:response regulator [Marinospirillum sp. MEB164]|uniref:Response regulator n=1 Tax=Marinospirillum alkalitolerans TaxID=3123374 RepID=A0ABW8PV41_9GAMM
MSTSAPAEPAPIRVIIADDTSIMRSLLRQILKDRGFQVVAEAGNGVDAVQLVKQHKPQVVCLDIEMPEMSGLEALVKIRKMDEPPEVIMVTGDSQAASVQQAMQAGARGYILKPFQADKIVSSIYKALQPK